MHVVRQQLADGLYECVCVSSHCCVFVFSSSCAQWPLDHQYPYSFVLILPFVFAYLHPVEVVVVVFVFCLLGAFPAFISPSSSGLCNDDLLKKCLVVPSLSYRCTLTMLVHFFCPVSYCTASMLQYQQLGDSLKSIYEHGDRYERSAERLKQNIAHMERDLQKTLVSFSLTELSLCKNACCGYKMFFDFFFHSSCC